MTARAQIMAGIPVAASGEIRLFRSGSEPGGRHGRYLSDHRAAAADKTVVAQRQRATTE